MSQTKFSYCLSRLQLNNTLLTGAKHIYNSAQNVRNKSATVKKQKTASSVYRTMNIFDRKAKVLQRERSAQRPDYHLAEYIKEEVGWRTADRIFDIKRTFKNAVELGASRGYVSRHFLPDSVEKVILCDTSQTHLDKALVGDGVKVEKMVMDEENIDFPDNSVDLLVSSLVLHWVNDLPGLFDKVMKCLTPDGVFMSCVYGGDTLSELRTSIQLAETERAGGVAPHISPFTSVRDIGGLLTAAGFTLQTVDVDTLTIWYPSAWDVMKDTRALGDANAAFNRPLRLNKDVQFATAAIYDEMYGKFCLVSSKLNEVRALPAPAKLVVVEGRNTNRKLARNYGKRQEVMLFYCIEDGERLRLSQTTIYGTGEVSLKDLHKIDEIIQDKTKVQLTPEDMK